MKNTFSLVSLYISSQDEENKRFLHGLCSPSTGSTALLQAVQILSAYDNDSFRYVRRGVIIIGRPPLRGDRKYRRGSVHPEVKFGVSSGETAVFRNVVTQS